MHGIVTPVNLVRCLPQGIVEPFQAAALPGAAPHAPSRKTVKALLGLLRSYPGGLTGRFWFIFVIFWRPDWHIWLTVSVASSWCSDPLHIAYGAHSSRCSYPGGLTDEFCRCRCMLTCSSFLALPLLCSSWMAMLPSRVPMVHQAWPWPPAGLPGSLVVGTGMQHLSM
eukprot:1138328-Pelagomonas_calceolata.AAC.3